MTGVNQAASIHLLAAIENAGYFEADVSQGQPVPRRCWAARPGGSARTARVLPHDAPGIGVEVDEDFLRAHPAIEGPGYV